MDEPRAPRKPCKCPLGRCHEEMYGVRENVLCRENQEVPIPDGLLESEEHTE